ncbi:hypothetical protein DFS34DRAFT_652584 [Phlyctochytrium arcticum]|nr:hypothetical protein DFS34DRAFT_654704 [Phlyctochytrium arcticum]KAI9093539.1 hypothetical protein DFS34DRAFT_652584 [Phlyctochytrium arcticum]
MTEVYNERLTLPTVSPFLDLQPGILNVHASDFSPVKPGLAYNSQNRRKFHIPKKGPLISNAVSLPTTPNPRFREGDYMSKVSRDAVEAYIAVEKHKAEQVYFDELDKDNLFPRKGRMVPVVNSVATKANSDGTFTAYHQPPHVRFMQNQDLGDTSKVVERPTEPGNPSIGNRPESHTLMGSNNNLQVTDNYLRVSEEVGRIGGSKGPALVRDEKPPALSIPSVTKDLRTAKGKGSGSPASSPSSKSASSAWSSPETPYKTEFPVGIPVLPDPRLQSQPSSLL